MDGVVRGFLSSLITTIIEQQQQETVKSVSKLPLYPDDMLQPVSKLFEKSPTMNNQQYHMLLLGKKSGKIIKETSRYIYGCQNVAVAYCP